MMMFMGIVRIGWDEYEKNPERFLVVDVRDPAKFKQGSLPGAMNVPLEAIAQRKYDLPKDKPVLLVCDLGHMSSLAALYLDADGYKAYVLEEGLKALKAH